jgi:hypothetical protein
MLPFQRHLELGYADCDAQYHGCLELGHLSPLFEGELKNVFRQSIAREQAADATGEIT